MRTYWIVGIAVLLAAAVFGAVQCANGSCGADFNAWDFFFGDLDRGMIIATWVIAGLALMQYRLTAQTAQKQLRPYLTVRKGSVHDLGPGECARIEVLMKNFGQTPALQLRLNWTIQYRLNSGEATIDIAGQRSLGLLAPSGEYRLNLVVSKPFTEQHIAGMYDGHAGLFVSGRIDYVDSFGRSLWTDFRMVYNQHSVPSDELSFCEEGNEAS